MNKHYLYTSILFAVVVFSQNVLAIENMYSGARSLGLSHANVTLHDVWSANNNQAGLAYIDKFELGFAYENRYGLSELATKSLQGALPFKFGTFGVTVQQFGFSDYSENKFGLAYGKKLSDRLALGVQLNYMLISIAEAQTQNKSGISAEIGVQAKLTDKLTFGAHVYNVSNASLAGEVKEKIPMILRLGINYEFSKKVFAVVDVEKNIDLSPNLKVGIEYHPIEVLYLRGGVNTFDFNMSFGGGLKLKNFNLDLAMNYQNYIGYVTQISVLFRLNNK